MMPCTQFKIFLISSIVVFSLTGCTLKNMELTESGLLTNYSSYSSLEESEGLEEMNVYSKPDTELALLSDYSSLEESEEFQGKGVDEDADVEPEFLSDYSSLEEDEELEGMHVYKNPDVDIGKLYSKILIAPVEFKLDPRAKKKVLDPEDRTKMSDYFHEKFIEGLVKNYEIVYEPASDVLLFRAVMTVLPSRVYLNLHWSTTLMGRGIGGASLEAELVDSLSGERMLTFTDDARKGKKFHYTKGLTRWGHSKKILKTWAQYMVRDLDQLKEQYMSKNVETSWEIE